MISYEASKWHIKLWRNRWYLYAIFLHLKNFINVELWIELILHEKIEYSDKKKLRMRWNEIIRHIELSKMYKFSTKNHRDY
jgi:hypothetical protein